MGTKDTPQGIVGLKFAHALLSRDYDTARAMLSGARLIIMDEPTSALAAHEVRRLFDLIRQLRNDGISIVYISHFLEEVEELADRLTVLRDGKTVGSGPVNEWPRSSRVLLRHQTRPRPRIHLRRRCEGERWRTSAISRRHSTPFPQTFSAIVPHPRSRPSVYSQTRRERR